MVTATSLYRNRFKRVYSSWARRMGSHNIYIIYYNMYIIFVMNGMDLERAYKISFDLPNVCVRLSCTCVILWYYLRPYNNLSILY